MITFVDIWPFRDVISYSASFDTLKPFTVFSLFASTRHLPFSAMQFDSKSPRICRSAQPHSLKNKKRKKCGDECRRSNLYDREVAIKVARYSSDSYELT